MTDKLPVIDLTGLAEGDEAALRRIAREIGEACRRIGFFYVVNHGVAPMTRAAFAQSRAFFALPRRDKARPGDRARRRQSRLFRPAARGARPDARAPT